MAKNEDTPQTPQAPDPWAILNKLADALASAQQSPKAQESEGIMARLTSALERVSEAQLQGSKMIAEETRRAYRRSNELVPNVSVFNRRGTLLADSDEGPRKPPLKCTMLIPHLVEWESCTREEVELLNLLEPGEYTMTMIDKSKVRIGIKIDYKLDGKTPSRLLLNSLSQDGSPGTAFNNNNFRLVPAMADWLRQILRQHNQPVPQLAALIMSDEEEEALIEAGQLTVSA